jgi:hypothetical protein
LKVRDLIPGKLKKADIYFSEFEDLTIEEFMEKTKDDSKAKRMLKLISHKDRLVNKRNQTDRL